MLKQSTERMDWKRHTAGAQEAVGHNAETAQRMDWKRHTARAQEAVGHNAETEHREWTGRDIQLVHKRQDTMLKQSREWTGRDIQQVYMRQKGAMLKQSRRN